MADQPMAVSIDAQQVTDLLQRAPDVFKDRFAQLIEGAAIDVQGQMRLAAPVAVTGQLRNSIGYTMGADRLSAVVEPSVAYAEDVEYGTQPHSVSVSEGSSLRDWADFKGINPYALQNAIAARGTQAHPFLQPTFTLMEPKVRSSISAGVTTLVGDFNNGRL